MNAFKVILRGMIVIMPWPLKRWFLSRVFGYRLDPAAYIGLAWVYPKMLVMAAGSHIDHLCTAIHLDEVNLGREARIGRGTWITGFPSDSGTPHFAQQRGRVPRLVVAEGAAITKNHHIDCTSEVNIGKYTTVAGYNSQILSHSIDLKECRQSSAPIVIGDYCFLGTNVVVLGGAKLPGRSVLGAHSLLNKPFGEEWSLYAGVPATKKSDIPRDYKYFFRERGYVE
jgi:carbonic anhydrase/acetyltransferase-like protein (isoleucine patch superfamily)